MTSVSQEDLAQVESYRQIQERKQLLKRVVAITQALERMQESLQAVLCLEDSSTSERDIPEQQLRFFQQFRERMVDEPNARLQQYLLRLQTLVSQEMRQILQFSEIDPDDAQMQQVASSEGLRLLKEFQRRAQTAVGLRVLLAERGVALPKAVIPVPRQKLKAQLQDLRGKEQKQRRKVEGQILEMRSELQSMIGSSHVPKALKGALKGALEGLTEDLAALHSGQLLSEVTLSFEAVQAEAIPPVENEQVRSEVPAEQPHATLSESAPPMPGWRLFLRTLVRWLNSPWRVSWSQLREEERKRNGV